MNFKSFIGTDGVRRNPIAHPPFSPATSSPLTEAKFPPYIISR
jgi:hypothetical protein